MYAYTIQLGIILTLTICCEYKTRFHAILYIQSTVCILYIHYTIYMYIIRMQGFTNAIPTYNIYIKR